MREWFSLHLMPALPFPVLPRIFANDLREDSEGIHASSGNMGVARPRIARRRYCDVRSVVQHHGSSSQRRVYVLNSGAAPVLRAIHGHAAESYCIPVGRPVVHINIPVNMHLVFASTLAARRCWIHVRTCADVYGRLLWTVCCGSDPRSTSPLALDASTRTPTSDGRQTATIIPVVGSSLQYCLRRLAAQGGYKATRSWVSAADILLSKVPNWLTTYLLSASAMATVQNTGGAPCTARIQPVCKEAPRTVALEKKLQDVTSRLVELRQETKRLRVQNKRFQGRALRAENALESGVQKPSVPDTAVHANVQHAGRIHHAVSVSELTAQTLAAASAPTVAKSFVQSLLANYPKGRNNWQWSETDLAFFTNLQTRVGLCTYRYIASELGAPSVSTLQRVRCVDVRDVLWSSASGVQRLARYFDSNPSIPRRVIVQHDGIHLRPGVTWTKHDTFVGFVSQREGIAHYLTGEPAHGDIELASTAEVYMLTAVHSGIKHVVRVAPCAKSQSARDYLDVLFDVLESLDCNDITPVALSFDAATPVIRGLKLLAACETDVATSALPSSSDHAQTETGKFLPVSENARVNATDAASNPTVESHELVQLFAQQQQRTMRSDVIFGTIFVPQELVDTLERAHRRFPLYVRDPFSRQAILLCGDSAHLLKRDRNLLYSTLNPRQSVAAHDGNDLARLNWKHIVALRDDDRASQARGLPEQEPLLTDTFVNLSSWGKMSVPGALAVFSPRVVSVLRRQAANSKSERFSRELRALAKHLEVGRARFDVCRSKTLNALRDSPIRSALTSYNDSAVGVLRDVGEYYESQVRDGRSTSRSTIWAEMFSATVAMRCFVLRETSMRPTDGYIHISRVSTDPLESLFSYARQTNGGSSNPTLQELVLSVRRNSARNVSSQTLRSIKGNMEPERNQEILKELFLAESVVGRHWRPSVTSACRAEKEATEQQSRENAAVASILSAIRGPNALRLELRTMQVTARICGALLTLERRKLSKSFTKLAEKSGGDPTSLGKASLKKFETCRSDLHLLKAWTLPRGAPERRADVFADIREIERQDGLTYPTENILHLFYALVVARHHTVDVLIKTKDCLESLPSVLDKVFEIIAKKHMMSCDGAPLLFRIIARFRNSSCRSLQVTLNQKSLAPSADTNAQAPDDMVALRPRLAVKSSRGAISNGKGQ